MISAIVFSRNRAAQLDLLLRSIRERAPKLFSSIEVLWVATNSDYMHGYQQLINEWTEVGFRYEHSFQTQVGDMLDKTSEPFVSFLCDDDIVMREYNDYPAPQVLLQESPEILCFSLRLGYNTTFCYPHDCEQQQPIIHERFRDTIMWSWPNAMGDWGYPGSLDGHVFRRHQVIELLAGRDYTGPNRLEDTFTNRCFGRDDTHPMMASYERSLITGVPINVVQDGFPNRNGETHPVLTTTLNREYMEGKRLVLPEHEGINAAHVELPLCFA